MQDDVRSLAGAPASGGVLDVRFDERMPSPREMSYCFANVLDIASKSGREIVESDDLLPGAKQRFDEVGADEAGRSGDEPGGPAVADQP